MFKKKMVTCCFVKEKKTILILLDFSYCVYPTCFTLDLGKHYLVFPVYIYFVLFCFFFFNTKTVNNQTGPKHF